MAGIIGRVAVIRTRMIFIFKAQIIAAAIQFRDRFESQRGESREKVKKVQLNESTGFHLVAIRLTKENRKIRNLYFWLRQPLSYHLS